jgi:hypothetical protein
MDTEISSTTQYKPVTVDVPEDRVAEFHAFFARFLAGPAGRGRGRRHGRPHHGRHGHGHERGSRCAARRETAERNEPTAASTEV